MKTLVIFFVVYDESQGATHSDSRLNLFLFIPESIFKEVLHLIRKKFLKWVAL